MISPYLDQPPIPLAAALSRMLEKIETELADEKKEAAEKWASTASRVDPTAARAEPDHLTCSGALRRIAPQQIVRGRRRHGPWVWRTSSPLPCRRSVSDDLRD
jgi:hypothetical protein